MSELVDAFKKLKFVKYWVIWVVLLGALVVIEKSVDNIKIAMDSQVWFSASIHLLLYSSILALATILIPEFEDFLNAQFEKRDNKPSK